MWPAWCGPAEAGRTPQPLPPSSAPARDGAALVVYPIGYSVVRSFYDQSGDGFAGFDNYQAL
ncbi:hypothetical protein ABZ590_05590, partial [Streptomyces hirsutus]|uniref:hypothetical protein n=1 Tax=Streptomyces hirsutus TaxID=35620 RepID=UPI00341124A1